MSVLKHSASLPERSLWLLAPPNVVKISAVLRLAAGLSQRSRKGQAVPPGSKSKHFALIHL